MSAASLVLTAPSQLLKRRPGGLGAAQRAALQVHGSQSLVHQDLFKGADVTDH